MFYYISQVVRALRLVNLEGRTLLYVPLKFKFGFVATLFRDLSLSYSFSFRSASEIGSFSESSRIEIVTEPVRHTVEI